MNEFAAAIAGPGGKGQFGDDRTALCLGLADQRVLELNLGIDVREPRTGGVDIRRGLRNPGAIVPVVDPEQNVACLDDLVIRNFDDSHVTGDLRRQRGEVSAHISVVVDAWPEK